MALSAFGDDLDGPEQVPGPAIPESQAAPQRIVSAFGDDIDAEPEQALTAPQGQAPTVGRRGLPPLVDNGPTGLGDVGRSVVRGAVGLSEGVVGLGDLVSGGGLGNYLQSLGYDPQAARKQISSRDTPERQASAQALDKASGFGGTLDALAANPGNIPHLAIESLPSMIGGGLVGRGIALGAKALGAAPAMAGVIGAGAGEGLIASGQQAEQTRQQTGDLTLGQSGLALLSGGLTGLLGAAGARIGRKLGVADIDAQMAGQNGVDVATGLVHRALVGTGIESLEELSQSGQQQVLTNLATDRPALEGVGKQMVIGGALGGAMGGAVGLRRPNMVTPAQQATPAPMPAQQPQAMAAAPVQAMPALGPTPSAPQIAPQPTPAPTAPKVPFAGSQNVRPLFESMGMDQRQMDKSLDLLRGDEPEIEVARRGTISWEETGRLAALTGITIEKLRKHRVGVAFNAEEQVAATRLLKDQTLKTLELGNRISTGNASEIDQANFLQSLADLRSTQKAVMSSRAEIGRAMSAMRADVTSMKQASSMLESVGGAQGAKAIAEALTNATRVGGVEAANKLARQAGSDGFWTAYKSLLLSSPDTHVVNMVSNLFTSALQVPTRTLAGGIGAAKRAVGLNGETRLGEPVYQLAGMLEGAINGAKGAVSSWQTGEDAFGGNKAEVYRNDLPGQKVWGVPLRLLQSEDQFFKYLNDGMARYAGAYRMAVQELKGQSPTAVHKRVQELVANPPQELVEAGQDAALFHTFNNQAGKITQAVNNLRHSLPHGTGNLVVPFLKTPANLITYAVKHSPAAPIFKEVRQDLHSGGARQEEALARMGIGSLLIALGSVGVMGGNLTGGGPEDPEARKAWLAAGNQPYSLKVNGRWQQYSRIEPIASLVGIAADVASGAQDQALGMGSIIKAVGRNFTSKTWLQGLSGVMQAMTDPDRYGASWINRSAATLAQPATLLSHIGRYMDPYQRQTDRDSFVDQLKYRLPGETFGRESLPIKLDQYGQPIMESQRQIGRAGPIPITTPSEDPVRVESGRLGWSPPAFKRALTNRSKKVQIPADQYHELAQLAGQLTFDGAQRLMRTPGWASLDDDARRDALERMARKVRAVVRLAAIPFVTSGNRQAVDRLRNTLGRPGGQDDERN
ncbi:hypothetical protein LOY34_14645 [Pseudomonas sp. B21-009]|uniref:hypothetical protein n=1 Tax=Pseudomonas sp. B21-009 TaxID=2895470 RepID=UPI00215E7339|nr:hypothetical protein [Pseudomonas sp. B21-009]UVM64589.1 hypothetical protein LOY34_14645 [Pseudomonas sp. B21-009]